MQVAPTELDCPDDLNEVGREIWTRVCDSLPAGVVTSLDIDALGRLCRISQTYARLYPKFDENPLDKDLRITALALASELDKLGRQFGMTPQSRAALKVPKEEEEDVDSTMMKAFLARREAKNNN